MITITPVPPVSQPSLSVYALEEDGSKPIDPWEPFEYLYEPTETTYFTHDGDTTCQSTKFIETGEFHQLWIRDGKVVAVMFGD